TGEPDAGLSHRPWQYIRGQGATAIRSGTAQIARRRFAGPAIKCHLEGDLLSLVEAVHSGAFDSADVHEHILAAVIGLNEAEAFLAIKPFYCTLRHNDFLSRACVGRPHSCVAGLCSRFGEVVSPTRRARRGQVVRPKLDRLLRIAWACVLQARTTKSLTGAVNLPLPCLSRVASQLHDERIVC